MRTFQTTLSKWKEKTHKFTSTIFAATFHNLEITISVENLKKGFPWMKKRWMDWKNEKCWLLNCNFILIYEILWNFCFSSFFYEILEGIISYSIPKGVQRGLEIDLSDQTYDGHDEGDRLVDGLGQLVDGQRGTDNFRSDIHGYGKGK